MKGGPPLTSNAATFTSDELIEVAGPARCLIVDCGTDAPIPTQLTTVFLEVMAMCGLLNCVRSAS